MNGTLWYAQMQAAHYNFSGCPPLSWYETAYLATYNVTYPLETCLLTRGSTANCSSAQSAKYVTPALSVPPTGTSDTSGAAAVSVGVPVAFCALKASLLS